MRPVLTVIAGPNGSGKSFLTAILRRQPWFSRTPFLNPDDIAARLGDPSELKIILQAARDAEAQRESWLVEHRSFAFETVFSAPDKVAFLRRARDAGYRIRVFFLSTGNPEINAARVARRVMAGGHDVPITKIISRYSKSHVQAALVAPWVDRMYLFDNAVDGETPALCAWSVAGQWQVQRDKTLPVWATPIATHPFMSPQPIGAENHRGFGSPVAGPR
ncbi:MAG: zeta toxin family protein [Acidiferrobacter sp.]